MFYEDFQTEITKAWHDEIYEDTFTARLPKEVDKVCFGNFTALPDPPMTSQNRQKQTELNLKYPGLEGTHVFLIPKEGEEICQGFSYKKLDHAQAENNFFCKNMTAGKMESPISLKIESSDQFVTIKKQPTSP